MKILIGIPLLIILFLLIPFLSGGAKKEVSEFKDEIVVKVVKSIIVLVLSFFAPIAIIVGIFIHIESNPSPDPEPPSSNAARTCEDEGGLWTMANDGLYGCYHGINYPQE